MTRLRWFPLAVLGALLALGGCGSAVADGSAAARTTQEDAVTEERTTGVSTATESTGPDATSDRAHSVEASRAYLIRATDLPEGWRDSNPPNSSFRMTVCDVDLEPVEPVATTQVRFAQTAMGPFLYEYVRTYADAAIPQQVVAGLTAALPECTEFTTRGSAPDSPQATFEVAAPGVEVPEGVVGWRMTPRTDTPMIQDVVLIPRGRHLVAFLSASLGADPDPAVLDAALAALPRE